MSEHAFLSVICHLLDVPMLVKSPNVQFKEPYSNLDDFLKHQKPNRHIRSRKYANYILKKHTEVEGYVGSDIRACFVNCCNRTHSFIYSSIIIKICHCHKSAVIRW